LIDEIEFNIQALEKNTVKRFYVFESIVTEELGVESDQASQPPQTYCKPKTPLQ
jgi:hypothetical protein